MIPLITIITPTYNRKELLEQTILSVTRQNQSIPFDWELIIVDDGSTDNTEAYIKEYLESYQNIQYVYQENSWVGKARNVWLDLMNKKSDYVTFLDSDDELTPDCIHTCLQKWEELKKHGKHEDIIWLYLFKVDETWRLIGNQEIFNNRNELYIDYNYYLSNKMNFDPFGIFKSSLFLNNLSFRFEEDVISEAVLWAKIWQYFNKRSLKVVFYRDIGMLYRINNSKNKITKTISADRFRKNAIWNERVLDIIWGDLLKFWYKDTYADYLFRTGINWILYWERAKWLNKIEESLRICFSIKVLGVYIISIISRKMLLFLYKIYI